MPLRNLPDGLTEGEIEARIAASKLDVMKFFREELRSALDEQSKVLDKLRDGAQASINMSLLLVGDPALQIPGALPEQKKRLDEMQGKFDERSKQDDAWRAAVDKRLDNLELGQNRLQRCMKWCGDKIAAVRKGWMLMAGCVVAFGGPSLGPVLWHFVKRSLAWMWHLLTHSR